MGDFSGGSVGFVRMEFEAGMVQIPLVQNELRASMSCKNSANEPNRAETTLFLLEIPDWED
jgi:hypothetical protein